MLMFYVHIIIFPLDVNYDKMQNLDFGSLYFRALKWLFCYVTEKVDQKLTSSILANYFNANATCSTFRLQNTNFFVQTSFQLHHSKYKFLYSKLASNLYNSCESNNHLLEKYIQSYCPKVICIVRSYGPNCIGSITNHTTYRTKDRVTS